MKKRIFSAFLAFLMVISLAQESVLAIAGGKLHSLSPYDTVDVFLYADGACGENLRWEICSGWDDNNSSIDYELTVSGTGDMSTGTATLRKLRRWMETD